MIENRSNSGGIRAGRIARNHFASGLLALVGIFCLLTTASCSDEKASQAEARAAQAEKKVAELTAEFDRFKASAAADKRLVDELHGKVAAAEARAKAAPVVAKVDKVIDVTSNGVAAKSSVSTEKAATKVDLSKADAIRVHSLAASAGEAQLATEYKEMAPALKACDKDGKLGLALCVLPKQGEYSSWLPVLVTWSDGAVPTVADARNVLACLHKQRTVNSAVNKTEKNAAELVIRSSFSGDCAAAPAE